MGQCASTIQKPPWSASRRRRSLLPRKYTDLIEKVYYEDCTSPGEPEDVDECTYNSGASALQQGGVEDTELCMVQTGCDYEDVNIQGGVEDTELCMVQTDMLYEDVNIQGDVEDTDICIVQTDMLYEDVNILTAACSLPEKHTTVFAPGSCSEASIDPDRRVHCVVHNEEVEEDAFDLTGVIQAFKPRIIERVKAKEVLQYLPFIENVDVFLAKEREGSRAAMTCLLSHIEASTERGKWQSFVHALEKAGYELIMNILRGTTEKDDTKEKRLLRLYAPQINQNIDADELIDELVSFEIISDRDKEEIQQELRNFGQCAAVDMSLDRVPRRIEAWFSKFLLVLRNCGLTDLAAAMEEGAHRTATVKPSRSKSPKDETMPKERLSYESYGFIPTSSTPRNSTVEDSDSEDDNGLICENTYEGIFEKEIGECGFDVPAYGEERVDLLGEQPQQESAEHKNDICDSRNNSDSTGFHYDDGSGTDCDRGEQQGKDNGASVAGNESRSPVVRPKTNDESLMAMRYGSTDKECMQLLLEQLDLSEEERKWSMLLSALKEAGIVAGKAADAANNKKLYITPTVSEENAGEETECVITEVTDPTKISKRPMPQPRMKDLKQIEEIGQRSNDSTGNEDVQPPQPPMRRSALEVTGKPDDESLMVMRYGSTDKECMQLLLEQLDLSEEGRKWSMLLSALKEAGIAAGKAADAANNKKLYITPTVSEEDAGEETECVITEVTAPTKISKRPMPQPRLKDLKQIEEIGQRSNDSTGNEDVQPPQPPMRRSALEVTGKPDQEATVEVAEEAVPKKFSKQPIPQPRLKLLNKIEQQYINSTTKADVRPPAMESSLTVAPSKVEVVDTDLVDNWREEPVHHQNTNICKEFTDDDTELGQEQPNSILQGESEGVDTVTKLSRVEKRKKTARRKTSQRRIQQETKSVSKSLVQPSVNKKCRKKSLRNDAQIEDNERGKTSDRQVQLGEMKTALNRQLIPLKEQLKEELKKQLTEGELSEPETHIPRCGKMDTGRQTSYPLKKQLTEWELSEPETHIPRCGKMDTGRQTSYPLKKQLTEWELSEPETHIPRCGKMDTGRQTSYPMSAWSSGYDSGGYGSSVYGIPAGNGNLEPDEYNLPAINE